MLTEAYQHFQFQILENPRNEIDSSGACRFQERSPPKDLRSEIAGQLKVRSQSWGLQGNYSTYLNFIRPATPPKNLHLYACFDWRGAGISSLACTVQGQ